MLYQNLLPASIGLAYIIGVSAIPQATTVLPFGIVDGGAVDPGATDGETIYGVVAGSGSGGTTYVLSAAETTGADDTPFVVTLVENASEMHAVVAVTDGVESQVATQSIGCGFSGDSAVCTQEIVAASDTFTFSEAFTTSGTADKITVVISTSASSVTESATGSASASGSSQSSGARKDTIASALVGVMSLSLGAFVMA